MKINILKQIYNTAGKGVGGGSGPEILAPALVEELRAQAHITRLQGVEMSPEEENMYGGWNRAALAGSYLADLVARARQDQAFVLGLLADCNSLLSLLGGLQIGPKPSWPNRVGLVYIDAHGDYNTPETSPSGMLGGMPVAVAAGKALHRLRLANKLQIPLQAPDIVMAGMRDLDGPEREMMEVDGLTIVSEQDLIDFSPKLQEAMEGLMRREDIIYVHVDLDIMDPSLAPAAGLPSPGGLNGAQLGKALNKLLSYPKVAALGLASYRAEIDEDGGTKAQVLEAILAATSALNERD